MQKIWFTWGIQKAEETLSKLPAEKAFYLSDGLEMFCKYFKYVDSRLKADILKDGFSKFNHDSLANLSYRYKHKKIIFKYEVLCNRFKC